MTFNVKQIDKGGYYMKRFKKLTAGLMGVVMALGVCGFTALADDENVAKAKIGDTEYASLAAAIEAAKTDKNKGCTIVLLGDVEENGFKAEDGDEFTIDFNGFTYTIDGTVGSTGTETNGMQLLKGSDITLENGTIKSDKAKILIQKYGTLKIDDMDLIGGDVCQYVISNNNGTTTITGETNITANEGWYAFDVYYWPANKYSDVDVIFDEYMTGTVKGKVEYANKGAESEEEWLEKASLTIENGNFEIVIEDRTNSGNAASIEIVNGSFTSDVSAYLAEGSNLVKDEDGKFVVMDENEYDDYLDDQRDSHRHSYSLKEGKTEHDDEEEEPVVTPEPEEEEGPFSDVGKDNPNYDAIVEVYEKGWMAGIADGVFAPNGTLTRGMAVTILWNRAGQPEPASVAPFLDVTSDAWYAKAVAWAYENGITSGYGDTYGPDDFLTTEQFTRMNDIANGRTPEVYVGGAPNATRGWVAGLLVME